MTKLNREIYTAQANASTCLVKILFSDTQCPFLAESGRSQRIADVTAFDEESFDGLDCFLCWLRRQDTIVNIGLRSLQIHHHHHHHHHSISANSNNEQW